MSIYPRKSKENLVNKRHFVSSDPVKTNNVDIIARRFEIAEQKNRPGG
jgi:hypothetical protein